MCHSCARCALGLLKVFMIILNILFFLVGGALLGIAIWLCVDPDSSHFIDLGMQGSSLWWAAVYTMMGVGGLIFLLGFLGFAGMCCENTCMLSVYVTLVFICIAGEITVAILAIVYSEQIKGELSSNMMTEVKNVYGTANNNDVTQSWDYTQTTVSCCGVNSYTDWQGSSFSKQNKTSVPWSCCVLNDGVDKKHATKSDVKNLGQCKTDANSSTTQTKATSSLYVNGCYSEVSSWIQQHSIIIYGVVLGLFIVQILAFEVAACMHSRAEEKKIQNYIKLYSQ